MYIIQHCRTKNDRNGNPRRIFVLYSGNGSILGTMDEGYKGTDARDRLLAVRGRKMTDPYVTAIPPLEITVREYNRLLKVGP